MIKNNLLFKNNKIEDVEELKKLADGIYFGEGPRWHDNKLWFSDFYSHKVMTLDENNVLETICEVPNLSLIHI